MLRQFSGGIKDHPHGHVPRTLLHSTLLSLKSYERQYPFLDTSEDFLCLVFLSEVDNVSYAANRVNSEHVSNLRRHFKARG
ncbi:MAG: hypothetical protein ACPGJV_12565 [Bacteriovoracaceae bacterium]